jgi:hypothetical protein
MKKSLFLIPILHLLICSISAQTYSGGNGTESSPYLISSRADMETLAATVNNGTKYSGEYFLLTRDLSGVNDTVRTVIGNDNSFNGTFDGGSHFIAVSITPSSYAGLFGIIVDATIKNLGVKGNVFTSSPSSAGGVCGYAYNSTINNCYNTGNITSSISSAGGVCGRARDSAINNCYNTGNITLSSSSSPFSSSSVGGICGSEGTISN